VSEPLFPAVTTVRRGRRDQGAIEVSPLIGQHRLLLEAVTGAPPDSASRATWRKADWDLALDLAAWHRLAPVLYAHLLDRSACPPDVLAVLERAYLDNAARNLRLSESVREISAALAAAAIPAILLKGAALIESVYPDPALREMVDLDLLVATEQLDAAGDALAAVGLRPRLAARTERWTRAWMRAHHIHDAALVSEDRVVAVELHRHVAPDDQAASFDVADIWRRRRVSRRGGHLLPSPEDLLLHVCIHFSRDRRRRSDGALGQICDIARILATEDIDWSLLADIVRAYRLRTSVFLALFAARELGVAIPEQAIDALGPPGFDRRTGRRFVELRVLRAGRRLHLPAVRRIFAPPREVLLIGWSGAADARPLPLARAYVRRAAAQAPLVGLACKEPRSVLADYALNRRITALEQAETAGPGR